MQTSDQFAVLCPSSEEQMPLLCWSDSAQPVLLPLIYLMLRRRHKSVNTIRRDVSVLKWLYEWAEISLGLDIDAEISSGSIEKISGHFDQFAYWLRSGRVALNVIGRIGQSEPADWLHPKTYNEYLASLKHFLLWAVVFPGIHKIVVFCLLANFMKAPPHSGYVICKLQS
jgi:hypothetical protein